MLDLPNLPDIFPSLHIKQPPRPPTPPSPLFVNACAVSHYFADGIGERGECAGLMCLNEGMFKGAKVVARPAAKPCLAALRRQPAQGTSINDGYNSFHICDPLL